MLPATATPRPCCLVCSDAVLSRQSTLPPKKKPVPYLLATALNRSTYLKRISGYVRIPILHFDVVDEVPRVEDEKPLVEHVKDVRLLEHVAREERLQQSGNGFGEGQHSLRLLGSVVGEMERMVVTVFRFRAVSVVRHLKTFTVQRARVGGPDSGVVLFRYALFYCVVSTCTANGRGSPVYVLTMTRTSNTTRYTLRVTSPWYLKLTSVPASQGCVERQTDSF